MEVQEGSSPGSSKNLHLMGLKSGPNTAQQYVDGYIFFMGIAVQSHRKIPQVQNFQVSYKKKMCMFYGSSWIIFLKFKRQAI